MIEKQKRRILFFVPLPPPITGAGLRNKSLVESDLLKSEFDIEVIPFNFAKEVDDIGRFSITKAYRSVFRFFEILLAVHRFRPHLVYFNFSLYGFALYRDFIYVLLFKSLDCNILYHLRTQGIQKQIARSKLKKGLFQFVFRNEDIICLSHYLGADLKGVYSGSPLVVNNGIEDVSHRYPVIDRLPTDPPRVLYLGHLWKFKGIIDLIQAVGILKGAGFALRASIVGPEGDLRIEELSKMISDLNIGDCIEIRGSIEGDSKYALFRSVDILALPTHWEAFPGVVLEAMQFGLPVVATREGAIPEIVDDGLTGLLHDKGDIDDLARKLGSLVRDLETRRAMGIRGRRKFEQCYALHLFESNMKNAFLQVLNKRLV